MNKYDFNVIVLQCSSFSFLIESYGNILKNELNEWMKIKNNKIHIMMMICYFNIQILIFNWILSHYSWNLKKIFKGKQYTMNEKMKNQEHIWIIINISY
jgi:hypothetical protein